MSPTAHLHRGDPANAPRPHRTLAAAGAAVLALAASTVVAAGPANAHGTDHRLAPRTHFTMAYPTSTP